MSKIYYYITMTIGLTILMKIAGISYPGDTIVLNWLGLDPTNYSIQSSLFYISLMTPIVGFFAIAFVVGSIFSKESTLRAGLVSGIMGVGIGTFVGILDYAKNISTGSSGWIFYVIFMIFGVYIAGFMMSLIEWWGGTG